MKYTRNLPSQCGVFLYLVYSERESWAHVVFISDKSVCVLGARKHRQSVNKISLNSTSFYLSLERIKLMPKHSTLLSTPHLV